jgi:hypothetical protein
MAFNLGAFAGGLVSGGLKTYQTMSEIERLRAAEERDKVRFEEEQRKIELGREAETLQRKAAIPDAADQPGRDINAVVSALPIGGSETSPGDLTKTTDAYQQKFKDVFGGLTPEQQALVLRQYGDASTPGGAALQQTQTTAGAPEALAGLNTAVVRQDAGGGRSVVQADTDEKKTVARYKAMAMASGNPLAIKAANEAEVTMLNRQVAQQQIAIGEQNIDLNKYKIGAAKTEQEFKDSWTAEMKGAKEDHFKLMKQIDTAATDSNASLDSLVSQFGPKLKDVTGQTYSVADGKIVTTGADGKSTVVASDVGQAVNLLKQAATNNFAQDFQDRILSKGLFQTPADLAAFIKDKQDFFFKTGTLATQQITAAAATKNAESAAVSAAASKTTADANASKVAAELKAGIPEAHAALFKAQAGSATAMASHYGNMSRLANESAALSKDAREEVKAALAEFEKLTPEQQKGPEGEAALTKASMIYAKKSGDINGLITALKRPDGTEEKPMTIEKFMESFGTSPSSFKDGNGNAIPIGQLSPPQAKAERDAMYRKGASAGGLPDKTPPPPAPPGGKAADTAAAKTAIPYTPPAGSPAAIELEKRKAAADAKDQATKTLRDTATAAATAAISASSQVDARKVQQMDGFSLLPVAVQAQISKIVNKPVSAIPVSKGTSLTAKELATEDEIDKINAEQTAKDKAAAAAPAPAAGKSVKAQEENLSYKVVVAQSTYDRRPGATTKAQLDSAQQELANFRKANGIK